MSATLQLRRFCSCWQDIGPGRRCKVFCGREAYISARVLPRARPWVAVFSEMGTLVCASFRRRRSFVLGGDFFLSADFRLGMDGSGFVDVDDNVLRVRGQWGKN